MLNHLDNDVLPEISRPGVETDPGNAGRVVGYKEKVGVVDLHRVFLSVVELGVEITLKVEFLFT